MADFEYTIGVGVDSSGIDGFIQKVRGIAQNINFGGSFALPSGVTAAGPGVAGGNVTFPGGPQASQFAGALQQQSLAALQLARSQGVITPGEYARARQQVEQITAALVAGARRFEGILAGTTPTRPGFVRTESGLEVPESVLREDASRAGRAAIGVSLASQEAAAARSTAATEERRASAITREIREVKERELAGLQRRLALLSQHDALDSQIARAKAQILIAEQQQARAEREQAQLAFRRLAEEGFFRRGTVGQRVQAFFQSRNGNIVDPLSRPTGGQLLGNRIFQASSFAIGGLAFYGGIQLLRDTLQETEKLERELLVVRGQIDRTFGQGADEVFDRFRDRVREISQETGALGSEVAFVQRQLAAAFVDPSADQGTQRAQFELASANAEQAFKFAEVTGLSSDEITDSLTALGLSFTELEGNFGPILDSAIALEEEFGVLGGEIITFAADLAPLAANLGFTAEQLTELGAVAQKFSGRSGGALAEQFGRILTDLPTRQGDLIALFSQTPELADLSAGLADAFVSENMEQVLEFILTAANRVRTQGLDPNLIGQISDTVAGRREGATFAAILRQPVQLLDALREPNERAAGAVDRRWQEVRDAITETMQRLRRAVEQFAQAILEAGLADVFKDVLTVLTALAQIGGGVIRFFDGLNDALGGLPGRLLAFAAVVRTVNAGLRTMAELSIFGLGRGRGPGGGLLGRVADAGIVATSLQGLRGAGNFARGIPAAVAGAGSSLLSRIAPFAAGATLLPQAAALGGRFLTFANPVAGGIAGVAAPAAAALASFEAYRTFRNTRASVNEMEDALRAAAQTTSYRQLIAGIGGDNGRLVEGRLGGIPGVDRFSRFITDYDSPTDILSDVLGQRAGAGGLQAALGALNPDENLTEEGRQRYNEAINEIEKALRGEEANLDVATELIGDIAVGNTGLADVMASALEGFTQVEEAAAEISSGSSGPEFQAAVQALQARRATPQLVRATLDRAVAPFRELAAAAARAGDYGAYLANMEQIAQFEEAAEQAISAYAASALGLGEELRGVLGTSTPETRIESALSILQSADVTDPGIRLQAVQSLQDARNEAFDEALRRAQSEADILNAINDFGGPDPIAQAEALYQQIDFQVQASLSRFREQQAQSNSFRAAGGIGPVGDFSPQIESLEGLTSERIALISEQLQQDIITYGEGALEIRLNLLRARRDELLTTIAALRTSSPSAAAQLQSDLDAINEQISAYEGLINAGIDPTTLDLGDGPNTDQQLAANEAILNRQLAQISVAQAQAGGNAQAVAALAQQAAELQLQFAVTNFGPGSIEAIQAMQQLASANNQALNAARDLALAQIAIIQARAGNDPVAQAAAAQQAAAVAAQFAQGPAESAQAIAQMITANNQMRQALADASDSYLELAAARTEDPIRDAQIGVQLAQAAVTRAEGAAERNRALAEQIDAERNLRDAVRDVLRSQIDVAIALLEAAGHDVEAVELAVQQSRNELDRAIQEGAGEAAINDAQANVISQEARLRDTVLASRRDDIDFALEMGQITTQQAIAQLQALLQIPNLTEEQIEDIHLTIRRLRDQLGSDFRFNLPDFGAFVPTLYEVNRLGATGAANLTGYNDNRQINVQVNVTQPNASAEYIGQKVSEAVGQPNRNGTTVKRY